MTEAGRGRRLVARTAVALLALAAATGARAACTIAAGDHIFAFTGDSCPDASGTYTPTAMIPGAPPPQPIVGLYAEGGTITASSSPTPITISATAANLNWTPFVGPRGVEFKV